MTNKRGAKITNNSFVSVLREIYGPKYYEVEGAKEELLARIEKLSSAYKAILGIETNDDEKS